MLNCAGEAGEWAMVIQLHLQQRQFFRTPHDQTPKTGDRGPKFSGQHAKFGCPCRLL